MLLLRIHGHFAKRPCIGSREGTLAYLWITNSQKNVVEEVPSDLEKACTRE
jgi:hypothetical protein